MKSITRVIKDYIEKKRFKKESRRCLSENTPASHKYKEELVGSMGKENKCTTLIETGTYKGDMVNSQLLNFRYISSIEVDETLYSNACDRFRNDHQVYLYHGDSSKKIADVIRDMNGYSGGGKICFFLDGHWSNGITGRGEKDTPIIEELTTIFEKVDSAIILIDDARCFVNEGIYIEYPTLKELYEFVKEKKPKASLRVEKDIIRIVY